MFGVKGALGLRYQYRCLGFSGYPASSFLVNVHQSSVIHTLSMVSFSPVWGLRWIHFTVTDTGMAVISAENSTFWAHLVFARADVLSDAGDISRDVGGCRRIEHKDRTGHVGGLEADADFAIGDLI